MSQHGDGLGRQLARVEHTGGDGVLNVVVQKRNVVGAAHNAALGRAGPRAGRVGHNAVAHLPGQVKALPVALQIIHHAQALAVVGEPARAEPVERSLPRVAERRVAQIVAERDGLGQILIQAQRAGNRACDLGDLQRMGQAGAVVVALRGQKDLRFLL